MMDNSNQETTAPAGILHTSENKKNVARRVRFAGINLGEITYKLIIEELKKIQLEKFGK